MNKIVFLLVILVSLSGCGRSSQDYEQWHDSSGILRFIPSDSPFVGVRLTPFPPEFRERFAAQNALLERANSDAWQALLNVPEAPDETDAGVGAFRDTIRLFDHFGTAEGSADAGISPETEAALYWVATQPVLRLALLDEAAFEQFADELPDSVMNTPTALRGQTIRYLEIQGVRFALLVDAGYAVLTPAPEDLGEPALAAQLGLTLPSVNIAVSGALGDIAETHGMTGGQLVYLQPAGLFDALQAAGGLQTHLLAHMPAIAGRSLKAVPEDCLADIRRTYSSVESVTLGFSEAGAAGLKGAVAVDIEPSIAKDLKNLARPVPGLGMPTDALVSFGFSLNAKTLRRLVENRVASILENPYQCAAMSGLNAQAARLAVVLDKQPTPPTVRDFRGIVVSADWPGGSLRASPGQWMNASFRWVLATDKPESLVAFGNLFVPQLAALNLQPDGTTVEVPAGLLNPTGKRMAVAMLDDRLVGAVGPDGAARLETLKNLKASEDAPLFAISVDVSDLLKLSSDASAMSPAGGTLLDEMAALYARQSLQVRTTPKGLRLDFEISLKEESK